MKNIRKVNKQVIRSSHREEKELPNPPLREESKNAKRKHKKRAQAAERKWHNIESKTPEERNREMRSGRVPVFEKRGAAPRAAPPSKKKRPRI